MYLPLVGLFAVALSNQVFKKPQEFCPYGQTTYIKVSTSSVISCAAKCDTDKGGCSRFVYDEDQGECTMYWSIVGIMNGSIDTSTGRTLFLSSRKECILGYDYDANTNSCFKVYNLSLSWYAARTRCQGDGGDLVTMTTRNKWDYISMRINCESGTMLRSFTYGTIYPFWIGLFNQSWLSEGVFVNMYGVDQKGIEFSSNPDKYCTRMKYNLDIEAPIIRYSRCTKEKRFVCELSIP